jgi:hypothetical protein
VASYVVVLASPCCLQPRESKRLSVLCIDDDRRLAGDLFCVDAVDCVSAAASCVQARRNIILRPNVRR